MALMMAVLGAAQGLPSEGDVEPGVHHSIPSSGPLWHTEELQGCSYWLMGQPSCSAGNNVLVKSSPSVIPLLG